MRLRVVSPMRRRGSSNHYLRQRIPQDVLDRARGAVLSIPIGDVIVRKTLSLNATEVKVSLKTSDPSVAKSRNAIAAAYLEGYWRSLRNGPEQLTHKQCVALSGELYTALSETFENDPGSPTFWVQAKSLHKTALQGEVGFAQLMLGEDKKRRWSLERVFGEVVDVVLARKGLVVDDASRFKLLEQAARAADDAANRIERYANGDYRADDVASRFPKWEDSTKSKPKVTLSGLLDGWWREAKAAGRTASTRESYARTISYLRDYLGHEDATKVTPKDVIGFKDHRLQSINARTGKPVSPKTVKDSDLAALKSIFGWGLNNQLLESNPAHGITIKVGRQMRSRPKYFRADEQRAILVLAQNYRRTGREGVKLALAKRWVPWLCAYTGARVGEIAQLRKQDILEEEGHWIIRITPEAGTVKTKEARDVPIHEHLISQGFLDFVQVTGEGYLFLDVSSGAGDPSGKRQALKNRLSEFVRSVVDDPAVAPNHGWRHTFKTVAREIEGLDPKVLDDIVGHMPRTEGDSYGASTIKARAKLMRQFPRLL